MANHLQTKFSKIICLNHREISKVEASFFPNSLNYVVNFTNPDAAYEKVVQDVLPNLTKKTVIINFMGTFGTVSTLQNLSIETAFSTMKQNLVPFFVFSKLACSLLPGSAYISFSGAGVGGENLDASSYGYASSKGSAAILIDAINKELNIFGNSAFLIAPGPFPSKMQRAVLSDSQALLGHSEIVERAREVLQITPNVSNLVTLFDCLIDNLDLAGGKVFSANWDHASQILANPDLGKIRRIF